MLKHMPKLLLKFEIVLFWLVVLLLVFIPLYPKLPLVQVKGTFVAIRLEDLLIALVLILWVIYLFLSESFKKLFEDKLVQALLLFFFIGFISLFSAVFITQTVVPRLGMLHYLRRVELMMLLPLVYSVIKTKKQVVWAVATILVVASIINVYALGQEYLNWPVISTTNSEFSKGLILHLTEEARVNSTFAGHYDLAVFLVMVLVLLTALFFVVKELFMKILITFLFLLSFIVLVMTAARLSFVAALAGIPVTLILLKKRMFVLLIIAIAALAFIYPSQLRDRFISTITINLLHEGERYTTDSESRNALNDLNLPTIAVDTAETALEESSNSATPSGVASDIAPGEPIDTTQLGVYRSFEIRLNVEWPRALRAFWKNPLLGTGYSSIGLATDNDFLRSLGEVGILGTAAFVLILSELLKRIWENYRQQGDRFLKYFSAGVLSMVLAFLLNGMFIDVFEASKIATLFWMIVGLNMAVAKLR